MDTPFLEVKNLQMFYKLDGHEVRAVDDVSFEIEKKGESLAVVGESGCGKSSLALALDDMRLFELQHKQIAAGYILDQMDMVGAFLIHRLGGCMVNMICTPSKGVLLG